MNEEENRKIDTKDIYKIMESPSYVVLFFEDLVELIVKQEENTQNLKLLIERLKLENDNVEYFSTEEHGIYYIGVGG